MHDLESLAEEIMALESETFEIADYEDASEAILASFSCSTSSSSTTSCTS